MAGSLTILPDPPEPPRPVGLIAGGGRLPIAVAEGLRARGNQVVGLGLMGQYDEDFPSVCHTFREVGVLRIGSWGRVLRRLGVRHAVMVGKVDKALLMHDPWRLLKNIPDLATVLGWYRHLRHDRRSYAVLAAIADELDRRGVALMDSTIPIPGHISVSGVMGRVKPTRAQEADIRFAWPLLTQLLGMDIGQAVAVRERDVLAVEAVEGTDRMIERVGVLCRARGWTLCKAARAGHDRRSDVPTVGVRTIEHLAQHGAGCLAVAADDVIMLDRENLLARADELGIAVVGIPVSLAAAAPLLDDAMAGSSGRPAYAARALRPSASVTPVGH